MRIKFLFLIPLFFYSAFLFSQTTLPNLDFEDWTSYAGGQYEEPSGGVWATPNKVVLLSSVFPVSTEKTIDAYSGTYAAKMSSIMTTIGMLITGSLATGTFDETETPPNNMHLGMPFSGRPERFIGYYKYMNNNGDSCAIYATLSKWDGVARQEIGKAELTSTLTVNAYTKFDLEFIYSSADTPDSISVVFASSAAGDLMQGNDGSTLYIDSVAFSYPAGINELSNQTLHVSCYPVPASNQICFELERNINNGVINIFNESGSKQRSLLITKKTMSLPVDELAPGKYLYQIIEKNDIIHTGSFIVN